MKRWRVTYIGPNGRRTVIVEHDTTLPIIEVVELARKKRLAIKNARSLTVTPAPKCRRQGPYRKVLGGRQLPGDRWELQLECRHVVTRAAKLPPKKSHCPYCKEDE